MGSKPILVLLAVLFLGARAQPAHAGDSPFVAETSVQIDVGLFGVYLAAEAHLVWRPSWFAAGAGVKLLAGVTQFDVSVAPFVRVELGWFYANAGWVVELADRAETYRAVDDGLYTAAGMAPDLFAFASGRLGVDLGVEIYRPIAGDELDYPIDALVASWGLPAAVSGPLASVLGNSFLRLGLLYTFAL